MAGLIKRGKTYYAIYYVGKNQRRVSLKTSNHKFAKAKLAELELAQARGGISPTRPIRISARCPRGTLPAANRHCPRRSDRAGIDIVGHLVVG